MRNEVAHNCESIDKYEGRTRAKLRHEVVVCTKDRPSELRRCLGSLMAQTLAPVRIIVVDSTVGHPGVEDIRGPVTVDYIPSVPGLTHQRNVGLAAIASDTDVVHFVDDDAVTESDYLLGLDAVFREVPAAAGAGGQITNLPRHRPFRIERMFLLNSLQQGVLLRSGINVLSFTGRRDREVDWLSGCGMSFRVQSIHGLKFDEGRTGKGLGEDVDFSSRAARRGPLIWTPRARLAHIQSPINRDVAATVVRQNVRNRWQLASDGVGDVGKPSVIYSTVGIVVMSVLRSVRGRYVSPLRSAKAAVAGMVDLLAAGRPWK